MKFKTYNRKLKRHAQLRKDFCTYIQFYKRRDIDLIRLGKQVGERRYRHYRFTYALKQLERLYKSYSKEDYLVVYGTTDIAQILQLEIADKL